MSTPCYQQQELQQDPGGQHNGSWTQETSSKGMETVLASPCPTPSEVKGQERVR